MWGITNVVISPLEKDIALESGTTLLLLLSSPPA
jgi:hypothetical protein